MENKNTTDEAEQLNPKIKKLSEEVIEKIFTNIKVLIDIPEDKIKTLTSDEKLEYVTLSVEVAEFIKKLRHSSPKQQPATGAKEGKGKASGKKGVDDVM